MLGAFLYCLAWLGFAIVHSVLATESIKSRLEPIFRQYYRLAYNAFSVIHIIAVLIAGRYWLGTQAFPFTNSALFQVLIACCLLVGGVIMLLALRQYDLGLFSGTKQIRASAHQLETSSDNQDPAAMDNEPLNTSGLNQWVRHPLYSGAMVFMLGFAVSPWGVWTAFFGCAYFIIGSKFEERKLLRQYQHDYRLYRERVPAFIPSITKGRQ